MTRCGAELGGRWASAPLKGQSYSVWWGTPHLQACVMKASGGGARIGMWSPPVREGLLRGLLWFFGSSSGNSSMQEVGGLGSCVGPAYPANQCWKMPLGGLSVFENLCLE